MGSEATDHLPESICIDVDSEYLPTQSDPDSRRYAFAYTIAIRNQGEEPAQLLTRHWIITDANGRIQEVHGDGVVGEQPVIQPGSTHRYSSGAIIETPVGIMQGSYGMISDGGENFAAPIRPFRLAVPGVLN